jgi:hypothetical protein
LGPIFRGDVFWENVVKTLLFEYEGRALEVRMENHDRSFVCHVWEGGRQASSVPYTLSQGQVEVAEAQGDLEQVLDAAMAEVRDAVIEGELKV